jgi:type II secretory pathway pseudopilin PulG
MQKRGMSLVELIVAITIFITVMSLGVGAFVTVIRSRIVVGNMKDAQQKIRIANEMIIRYARQAQYVRIDPDGMYTEMYFDIALTNHTGKRFAVEKISDNKYDLKYSECTTGAGVPTDCTGRWSTETSLLGSANNSVYLSYDQAADPKIFALDSVLPAVMNATLRVNTEVAGSPNMNTSILVENAIILEGLK